MNVLSRLSLPAVMSLTIAAQVVPPPAPVIVLPAPLADVATPRPLLTGIVRNEAALLVLGKALFWDQQLGGDGVVACATCHFHAGADHRPRNQANAGANALFDRLRGPGQTQTPDLFPFGDRVNHPNADDNYSSQGTRQANFLSVNPTGSPVDQSGPIVGHRRTTGRNSPSVINAVFNFRNFWDGRASEVFNGRDPFGNISQNATILAEVNRMLVPERLNLPFSSLASQAVGPPNNEVELSFLGRDWADLGRKMLGRRPLQFQRVATNDSVLGRYASTAGGIQTAGGLSANTYLQLVEAAFQPKYTTSTIRSCFEEISQNFVPNRRSNCPSGDPAGYTLAESNFAMFFGLAIQAYEATLRSDQSKFDDFLRGERTLNQQETNGMNVFFGPVAQCSVCHFGPEFTNATVSALNAQQPGGGLNAGIFNANQLIARPPAPGVTSTARANCNGVTTNANCVFVPGSGADGGNIVANVTQVHGSDKRLAGAFERMTMAFRMDSTGRQVPVNLLDPFNLANDPLFGTPLGTAPVNQTTQSPFAVYDLGFYNVGVRPDGPNSDPGLGGYFPRNINGTAPFPATAAGTIPLSFTRRAKAEQATLSKRGTDDRSYWQPASGYIAFPFGSCTQQENQNLTAVPPVFGVLPFPANPNLVNPTPCYFFNAQGTAFIDPITLKPMLAGRLLNGPNYQKDRNGVPIPDTSCKGTTEYGLPDQCPEERDAVVGAFKTPGLRNVEFTGPYFHNGSAKSLLEAVQLYTRFHHDNFALAPEIEGISTAFAAGLITPQDELDLVRFLRLLTDPRVESQQAPFDHPSLCVPVSEQDQADTYRLVHPVGAGGSIFRLRTFEELLAGTTQNVENTFTTPCSPQTVPATSTVRPPAANN